MKPSSLNSYRQIMKGASLIGGVQVLIIIIGIIKTKFVAVLLGTTGMGILGLYTTTLSLVQTVTGLGLSSSAVRDIAEATGSDDVQRISRTIVTFRKWVWFTGLFGTIVTISFASLLSKWTFGTHDHTLSFVLLSIICLLAAISAAQNAVLQGIRQLKKMAKSSLWGTVLGLFTSVPLFYFYGLKGIVPSLIIAALCSLIISWYYVKQVSIGPMNQSWNETYHSGLSMVKLGIAMMLSGFMVTLNSYIITLFISNKGGTSDVGLYRAGWAVATQYTGLVFSAMGTDYFPRLTAIGKDREKMELLVNQQAEIGLVILCPLLVILICFVPFVIQLLYTKEFLPVTGMIQWSMMGMIFKTTTWAMGFIIIARGDNKTFLITETVGNVINLICNIIGYWLWNLNGIGISFFVGYFIYCGIIIILTKKRYNIFYTKSYLKLFSKVLLLVTVALILSYFKKDTYLGYIPIVLIVIGSIAFFIHEMNKRIEIKGVLNRFLKKTKIHDK